MSKRSTNLRSAIAAMIAASHGIFRLDGRDTLASQISRVNTSTPHITQRRNVCTPVESALTYSMTSTSVKTIS